MRVVGQGLRAAGDKLIACFGLEDAEEELGRAEVLSERGYCKHGFAIIFGRVVW